MYAPDGGVWKYAGERTNVSPVGIANVIVNYRNPWNISTILSVIQYEDENNRYYITPEKLYRAAMGYDDTVVLDEIITGTKPQIACVENEIRKNWSSDFKNNAARLGTYIGLFIDEAGYMGAGAQILVDIENIGIDRSVSALETTGMSVSYHKYDLVYRELRNWNTDNYIKKIYYGTGKTVKPGIVSPVTVEELRRELNFGEK